jgi:hypothetical protein
VPGLAGNKNKLIAEENNKRKEGVQKGRKGIMSEVTIDSMIVCYFVCFLK